MQQPHTFASYNVPININTLEPSKLQTKNPKAAYNICNNHIHKIPRFV